MSTCILLDYTPIEHFIRNTCTPIYSYNYLIRQMCGNSEMYKMFTSTCRMGKMCDLNYFDCGMRVGASQVVLSISIAADLLDFHA